MLFFKERPKFVADLIDGREAYSESSEDEVVLLCFAPFGFSFVDEGVVEEEDDDVEGEDAREDGVEGALTFGPSLASAFEVELLRATFLGFMATAFSGSA